MGENRIINAEVDKRCVYYILILLYVFMVYC
jgi:hypothetical protein